MPFVGHKDDVSQAITLCFKLKRIFQVNYFLYWANYAVMLHWKCFLNIEPLLRRVFNNKCTTSFWTQCRYCVRISEWSGVIGADSTGATGNFAPVLTQEPGQTLRFAPVPFMAVLWFFKWTLQLYLLNLTKGAKFARSVGHPMTKMLSASGGLRPLTRGSAPGPRWGLCP